MNLIHVEIVQDDIEHRITLGDFKARLLAEIGSVTWVVTRQQFERKVELAIDTVIQGIRDEKAVAGH